MTPRIRTSLALLIVLLFNLQSLTVAGSSVSADQAAWQHWQFHQEHGEHSHESNETGHAAFENQLHLDLSHGGLVGLVVLQPHTDSSKVPSRPLVPVPASHTAPHLGLDTPPPIA